MSTVAGLFETREQAQSAVEALKDAGFRGDQISIAMRDRRAAADVASQTGASNAAEAGIVGGGILGGLAGFLVGIGALAIPGIGPIVAAGPLVASLTGGAIGAATGGLLGALVEAGVPEEEAQVYQRGVERGGVLVTVNADGRESEARRVLERFGMRDAKYHNQLQSDPNFEYGRTDMSHHKDDGPDKTAAGTGAGAATGAAIGGLTGGPVGAAIGAGIGAVAGAATGGAIDFAEDDFRREYDSSPYRNRYKWEQARPAYQYGWQSYNDQYQGRSWNDVRSNLERNWQGQGKFSDYEDLIRTGYERRANYRPTGTAQTTTRTANQGEAVIPVVEEELQVGKRAVERGGVQVNVGVEQKPVEEQVNLREERVRVERRPVDREVTNADAAAFKEGTFEVREMAEEAVVNKRARVVEEIVIGKDVQERTETVRDTVRRTDVDVQQTGGQTMRGAATTGATSGATTGMTGGTTHSVRFEDLDNDFRGNYSQRYGRSGYSYDQYQPAYRYGYNLATHDRFRNQDWSAVEPEARRYWEERNQGTWDDFKDSVRYAWEKVRGRA